MGLHVNAVSALYYDARLCDMFSASEGTRVVDRIIHYSFR